MCKEKFGIEIETISRHERQVIANAVSSNFYRSYSMADKVDTISTEYHSHNVNKWGFESDGSLDCTSEYPYDCEIISPPLKINQLGELRKVLKIVNPSVKINKSCGVHVHVEVPNVETIKAALLIWRKFESKIIQTFSMSRRQNSFCHRLHRMSIETLLNFQFDRYHMINVSCYHTKGTIEFRGHSGTKNYNKLKRWILFATKLVERAKSYQNNLNQLASDLENSQDMFDFMKIKNTKTAKYMEARIIHFNKIEIRANNRRRNRHAA